MCINAGAQHAGHTYKNKVASLRTRWRVELGYRKTQQTRRPRPPTPQHTFCFVMVEVEKGETGSRSAGPVCNTECVSYDEGGKPARKPPCYTQCVFCQSRFGKREEGKQACGPTCNTKCVFDCGEFGKGAKGRPACGLTPATQNVTLP